MIVILLVMMSVICEMDILAVELAQPCIISTKGSRGLILLLVLMMVVVMVMVVVVVVVVGRMTPCVL